MRWLIVKFINLLIVLVAVTYIVASITSGPLAQIQIDKERELLQQQLKNLQGLTPEEKREWLNERLQAYIKSNG